MAKKVKKEKAMPAMCCEPAAPCLYLDFQGKDVKQLEGIAVGDEVEFVITGKVKGVSQRERKDYDDSSKIVKTGTVDLDNYKVKILEDETNEYTKLAEDDEG